MKLNPLTFTNGRPSEKEKMEKYEEKRCNGFRGKMSARGGMGGVGEGGGSAWSTGVVCLLSFFPCAFALIEADSHFPSYSNSRGRQEGRGGGGRHPSRPQVYDFVTTPAEIEIEIEKGLCKWNGRGNTISFLLLKYSNRRERKFGSHFREMAPDDWNYFLIGLFRLTRGEETGGWGKGGGGG